LRDEVGRGDSEQIHIVLALGEERGGGAGAVGVDGLDFDEGLSTIPAWLMFELRTADRRMCDGDDPVSCVVPKKAQEESRAVNPGPDSGLPERFFLFVETYCDDPGCDCRRVILRVIDTQTHQIVAAINHGFEPPEPQFPDEEQTFLDPSYPMSRFAPWFLAFFRTMISEDPSYQKRLERHYAMWKRVVDDPTHPDHEKVRTKEHDDPDFRPVFPKRAAKPTKPAFSASASKRWEAISPKNRQELLENTWCGACRDAVTMELTGANVEKRMLVLRGTCQRCGRRVVRTCDPE